MISIITFNSSFDQIRKKCKVCIAKNHIVTVDSDILNSAKRREMITNVKHCEWLESLRIPEKSYYLSEWLNESTLFIFQPI